MTLGLKKWELWARKARERLLSAEMALGLKKRQLYGSRTTLSFIDKITMIALIEMTIRCENSHSCH